MNEAGRKRGKDGRTEGDNWDKRERKRWKYGDIK